MTLEKTTFEKYMRDNGYSSIYDVVKTPWREKYLFDHIFDTLNLLIDEVRSLKEEVSKLNKSENQ
jgi:hypothetical protein